MASLEHVAVGCNAATNAFSVSTSIALASSASCNYCGAFAAKNVVCMLSNGLLNTANGSQAVPLKILETLKHQEVTADTTRLTSINIKSDGQSGDVKVLAGDSQGRVFLWTRAVEGPWKVQKLSRDEHKLPEVAVAAVAIAKTSRRTLYVASFSNGTLVVFGGCKEEELQLLSRLDLGVKSIMEAIDVTVVDSKENKEESVLLAAGGVDGKVHLFEVAGGNDTVTKILELEGHKGWIRSLQFSSQKVKLGEEVILASASQDQRIRLWKVTPRSRVAEGESTGEVKEGFLALGNCTKYTVSFDALLLGHEDWVTSVQWMNLEGDMALLSSSMDNTLIVWTKPADTRGSWSPSLRVGEMGGNGLLAAGALSTRDGCLNLLSLGFGGQLERWEQQPASKLFLPAISVNGHCSDVTDLSWSPGGDYLASVSLDQTARVLAPSVLAKTSSTVSPEWYEVSRAQVHGYDINCGCFVMGEHSRNDQFVSGADEKILRVFEAPDEVKQLVRRLKSPDETTTEAPESQKRVVQHAYLPELSLTNKSAQTDSTLNHEGNGYATVNGSVALPVGDTLSRKTLWPEQRKLYGHGNELISVASSHAGDLIASACKSREEQYAAVRLWNTSDWSEAQQPLEGHKSSVVQVAFSPNDQFLLSVSRDRQFCLYERDHNSDGKFTLIEHIKAHRRIIWSCSWSPDSSMFVLGSRDQSFSVWRQTGRKWSQACEPITVESAVRAVAFSPIQNDDSAFLLAVGLETGAIKFFSVPKYSQDATSITCTLVGEIPWELAPSSAVLRLEWHPVKSVLAAASSDNSVRIFKVISK
ncbi:Elongator complex protein 2 [Phytophthora citrophthora]|uniref:Elongator complex protein 2 n=1 Tax=Phytophthora citrophthora TaxID=4793 RepID=A0AAD9GXQ8_9STRA|nr:Elongator complex protein 2 [Phytophthora citrophthora]